jgi:hypothetical protein
MQNVLAFRLSNSLTDRGGGKRRPDIGFVNSSLWLWGRLFFGLLGLLSQPVMFFNPFSQLLLGKETRRSSAAYGPATSFQRANSSAA